MVRPVSCSSPPATDDAPAPPEWTGARAAQGIGHPADTARPATAALWQVAEEVPVAFVYNGVSHAVMMATPLDLQDFAVGFSIAEGLITSAQAIEDIHITPHHAGLMVALSVDPSALCLDTAAVRSMAGRSGCGLCGVESLEQAVRPLRALPAPTAPIAPAAVVAAMAALGDQQPLNRQTFSVHAAAWCSPDGQIVTVREDVGRHNALDKLIGANVRAGRHGNDGFVLMTSRCSFELVQKANAAGISYLATLSAPTALALELAAQAGMILASRAAGGGVMIFADGRKGGDQ